MLSFRPFATVSKDCSAPEFARVVQVLRESEAQFAGKPVHVNVSVSPVPLLADRILHGHQGPREDFPEQGKFMVSADDVVDSRHSKESRQGAFELSWQDFSSKANDPECGWHVT